VISSRTRIDDAFAQSDAPFIIDVPKVLEPHRKLMLAVLEAAVRDFQTYAGSTTARGRRLFMEADAWFASRAIDLFAFETICQAIDVDPDVVRDGLRRWRLAQTGYTGASHAIGDQARCPETRGAASWREWTRRIRALSLTLCSSEGGR
jgi:hypothetical protein